ncbi:MAG: MEDS domain-containing protein [Pseudomonadota bacterium]|nr:MEDS domain-containing protein [Pseudomonadota bacterium]
MNQQSMSKRKQIDVFWGELSACDHTVQIYEDDAAFLDALEGFVAAGIRQGDAIILTATPAHLEGLEQRLEASGFDVGAAIVRGQYIAVDAKRALATFMVDGWPDEALFEKFVDDLLLRAKGRHRKVRAFGEMVALMWAEGQCGATVRLEHLWTRLVQQESFSLFCAYPKTGFTGDANDGIAEVCAAHSRLYAI